MSDQIPNILNNPGSDYDFSVSDIMFSDFLCRFAGSRSGTEAFIYAFVARQAGRGHICVDIASDDFRNILKKTCQPEDESGDMEMVVEKLSAAGFPDEKLPLVRSGRFLYLKKFWDYQDIIEKFINAEKTVLPGFCEHQLDRLVKIHFPIKDSSYNWQMGAAICAARNRFCVITGGPGTGKTTTAAKIIAILSELIETSLGRKPRIFLAAPTGKAAARLSSSINEAQIKIRSLSGNMEKTVQDYTASTLHRLLGIGYVSSKPKYNRENHLPADILLVDEASMIDIGMMAVIMDALPSDARLIIMGDKDQLASVEPGAVLADICAAGPPLKFSGKAFGFLGIEGVFPEQIIEGEEGFHDGVVELDRSYRFHESSGIGHLAAAIRQQNPLKALDLLRHGKYRDISWIVPDSEKSPETIIHELLNVEFSDIFSSESPEKALEVMDSFRILCALREGQYGVEGINTGIREFLYSKKQISAKGDWYHGRPVIITANDYHLGLYNGDTGIALSDRHSGRNLKVYFRPGDGKMKDFHPARLGGHETAYASTVHKSQGSEYDRVILVLPENPSQVLSMELVYTAVTRAKKEFILVGRENIFSMAIMKRAKRTSGLYDRLLGLI